MCRKSNWVVGWNALSAKLQKSDFTKHQPTLVLNGNNPSNRHIKVIRIHFTVWSDRGAPAEKAMGCLLSISISKLCICCTHWRNIFTECKRNAFISYMWPEGVTMPPVNAFYRLQKLTKFCSKFYSSVKSEYTCSLFLKFFNFTIKQWNIKSKIYKCKEKQKTRYLKYKYLKLI